MKNFFLILVILFWSNSQTIFGQMKRPITASKPTVAAQLLPKKSEIMVNNSLLIQFLKKYPDFKKYQASVADLYKKRNYKPIWFQNNRLIDLAPHLHAKLNTVDEEGITTQIPHKEAIEAIFSKEDLQPKPSKTESELLLSVAYIWYAKKVFQGLDTKIIKEMGWLLPRKEISYSNLLKSLLVRPELLDRNDQLVFRQYYKLKSYLKKYKEIEKNGGWSSIPVDSLSLSFKPQDNSPIIGQIRERLTVFGDLEKDSKSTIYDKELEIGMENFKKRNGFTLDNLIEARHIMRMNIPIEDYIANICINMERCRWIEPSLTQADAYIFVNIPSYKLIFKRKDTTALESNVVVGETLTETAIFSGLIDRLVFSPFWNIPRNIIKNEIEQSMANDKEYLANHNMEWNNGNIRQKPGPQNPMGLVKFIFPNSNEIYLHDTPSKSLFKSEYRAYSHGCINVNKAQELAYIVLQNDPEWPAERITKAMSGEKETTCILKNKIPVHIGYFTALVTDSGKINFYYDVYERDECLKPLLAGDN